MRSQVKRWGNSASVRIPASVMAAAALTLEQDVDVAAENGIVTIRPVERLRYDLDELIAQVTPENCHPETDWGPPVGNEFW